MKTVPRIAGLVAENRLSSEPDSAERRRALCLQASGGQFRARYPLDILNIIASIRAYEQHPIHLTKADLEPSAFICFTKKLSSLAD